MFRVAREQVRGGIKPRAGGVRPLEQAFRDVAADVNVTFLLLPPPAGSGAAQAGELQGRSGHGGADPDAG
eukprot:7718451-Lingulodinium_polyedra.AAC.1